MRRIYTFTTLTLSKRNPGRAKYLRGWEWIIELPSQGELCLAFWNTVFCFGKNRQKRINFKRISTAVSGLQSDVGDYYYQLSLSYTGCVYELCRRFICIWNNTKMYHGQCFS